MVTALSQLGRKVLLPSRCPTDCCASQAQYAVLPETILWQYLYLNVASDSIVLYCWKRGQIRKGGNEPSRKHQVHFMMVSCLLNPDFLPVVWGT